MYLFPVAQSLWESAAKLAPRGSAVVEGYDKTSP
jgi:hypothetical protein